ncbi:MAG: CHAD domain-containing protein [Verrucomicrobia bacterium]|nr:CHAD domain-containing protein [Verrucomicrobiota bacterium]
MHEKEAAMGAGLRARLVGLCDAMEARLGGLLDSKRRVSEDVHEIRKLGKALRGGLALVGMPGATVRAVTGVGRLLAGQRDAVSRLKTWERLGWDEGPQGQDPAVRAVGALLGKLARSAGRRPPAEAVAWAQAKIGEVRQALARRTEDELQGKLPHGVRRLRRRVGKRMRRVGMQHRDAPAFHELRKALKAWLGTQALLGEPTDETCVTLAESLGDENDLSALETWLAAHGFSEELAPVVWQRVSDLHHKLRTQLVAARNSAGFC